jgi:uncharacterized protein
LTGEQLGAPPQSTLLQGGVVGASLLAGTYVGKVIVARIGSRVFQQMLDAAMLVSGLSLLGAATR